MHPLSSALPLPRAGSVTRSGLVAHRHSFAPPRRRTSHYHSTTKSCSNFSVLHDFVLLSESLWNDLDDPVFDGDDTGFESRANAFLSA